MSSPDDGRGKVTRRALIGGLTASAAILGGVGSTAFYMQPGVRVGTYSVPKYDPAALVDLLVRGIRDFPETVARVKGRTVVLKPNLVEYSPDRPINTNPVFVAAVAEAFRKLDAKSVTVAEGAGHRRDSEQLITESGLLDQLLAVGIPFVDLNADDAVDVQLPHSFTNYPTLPVARTVLAADVFVSVAKMKTHHFAGATLTMKNLFGTVPGHRVGWPKNVLHCAPCRGNSITHSIADLWDVIRPEFGIVDGIVGMEGDGPLRGEAVAMGTVVMGEQCPAVDATTARLMGLDPFGLEYLMLVKGTSATVSAGRIEVIGDVVAPRQFEVLPEWAWIKAT